MPALRRQRQVDLYKFKASLRAAQRNTVSKNIKKARGGVGKRITR